MLELNEMIVRLLIAIALGSLVGLEREMMGKEAGIRTAMLVSAGAAIFTMISIAIPSVVGITSENLVNVLPDRVVSNIVVGIGFLGAGIIIKTGEHVRGLTTAAVVWVTASIGALVGLGLIQFAMASAAILTGMLIFLRKLDIYRLIRPKGAVESNGDQQLD